MLNLFLCDGCSLKLCRIYTPGMMQQCVLHSKDRGVAKFSLVECVMCVHLKREGPITTYIGRPTGSGNTYTFTFSFRYTTSIPTPLRSASATPRAYLCLYELTYDFMLIFSCTTNTPIYHSRLCESKK